ncbi:MAG: undecaprenyldiphospho-muramoylpentapeptide beta-N-acetylglucosaminyltransferase [Spirochaetota bacterium]|nr:undecaprenyldiphospho-muramoylpentapeptide beta-N-acetylglucosaminyltransferase [Spirochaetota bacterium]
MLKLALTGGGSGGHTVPAMTVYQGFAQYARENNQDFHSVYLGSRDGIEREVAVEANIPYHIIATGKLRRYFSLKNITDIFRILKGVCDSFWILRRVRPDIVFSTGGFVSVPVVMAARMLSIPVVIHEQTSSVGLANKIAAKFARKVCVSFPSSEKYFPREKVILTGLPLRKILRSGKAETCFERFSLDTSLPLLYVTGGSQGSHKINTMIREKLSDLLENCNLIHQCGKSPNHNDFEELKALRETLPGAVRHRYVLKDFVNEDELKDIYAGSSLLLGRSGAGTVNECLSLSLPAIFIPLAIATRNEQYHNARILSDLGGGIILSEAELTADTLFAEIKRLISDSGELKRMKESLKKYSREDSTEMIIKVLSDTAGWG